MSCVSARLKIRCFKIRTYWHTFHLIDYTQRNRYNSIVFRNFFQKPMCTYLYMRLYDLISLFSADAAAPSYVSGPFSMLISMLPLLLCFFSFVLYSPQKLKLHLYWQYVECYALLCVEISLHEHVYFVYIDCCCRISKLYVCLNTMAFSMYMYTSIYVSLCCHCRPLSWSCWIYLFVHLLLFQAFHLYAII